VTATVVADEKLVSRIFLNIILNGLQAAHQDETPRVTIQLEQVGSVFRISFTDNGVGIDETLEEKIFIPHFTTKQSGSGLGLAIAKQGIEQLGGKIWFETSSKGTTFFIELKASV
jgi:signal transduction histidine kinase